MGQIQVEKNVGGIEGLRAGSAPLPTWQDALARYLKELGAE